MVQSSCKCKIHKNLKLCSILLIVYLGNKQLFQMHCCQFAWKIKLIINQESCISCSVFSFQDGGQCTCKSNVKGRSCDTCKDGFFNLDISNQDGCQQCSCNHPGTINNTKSCNKYTGQCLCKSNVEGAQCDSCKGAYYNLLESNKDGCTPCACNVDGTVGGQTRCDSTGQCQCKTKATGEGRKLVIKILFLYRYLL